MTSLALQHRDIILQRLAKGDRLHDIAVSIGYTHAAGITMQLKNDPDYEAARLASLDARMCQREDELEVADDGVKLARARELLSHSRWRAEREAPAIWGQKVETKVTHDISEDLRMISERRRTRTIDSMESVPKRITDVMLNESVPHLVDSVDSNDGIEPVESIGNAEGW